MTKFAINHAGKHELIVPALGGRPLIGRIWTGRTRREVADEYLEYNYRHGVLEIERKPGNVGAQSFRRIVGDIAEFTTISYWESMESMQAMHGDRGDVRRVSHLPRDPEYPLELPEFVTLTELHANDWRL
jgi:hypothetical protein